VLTDSRRATPRHLTGSGHVENTDWFTGLFAAQLQHNIECFNTLCSAGSYFKAIIGVVDNNEGDCKNTDSRIGLQGISSALYYVWKCGKAQPR